MRNFKIIMLAKNLNYFQLSTINVTQQNINLNLNIDNYIIRCWEF